jgi:hypothetical protein
MRQYRKGIVDQEDKVEERRKVLSLFKEGSDPRVSWDFTYGDAKRAYEEDLALLQTMKNVDLGMKPAFEQSIEIHQFPVVAEAPVSPKVMLNLIVGTAGGFLVSMLLAVPLLIHLNRMIPVRTAL